MAASPVTGPMEPILKVPAAVVSAAVLLSAAGAAVVLEAEALHHRVYVNQVETTASLAAARALAELLDCPVLAGSLRRGVYVPMK